MRVRVSPAVRERKLSELLKPDAAMIAAVARAIDYGFTKAQKALFESQGASGGKAWKPLSEKYKKRKDRLFGKAIEFTQDVARARTGRALTKPQLRKALGTENKILQLTGDYRRAMAVSSDSRHVAEGSNVGKRILIRLGARGPLYFAVHAEGAPPVPQRSVLQFTNIQIEDMRARARRAMGPFVDQRMRAIARASFMSRGR